MIIVEYWDLFIFILDNYGIFIINYPQWRFMKLVPPNDVDIMTVTEP